MPLKGKYLKYSPEITLEIFTLVWDKLIENGCKFEYSKEIIFDRFKFHDRVLRYDSNRNYVYPLMGINSCKKTTVQKILGYDPFVKDDFVLPDKWCIKTTKNENGKLIGKWFDKQSMCRCYYDTCLGEYYNSYNLLNESIILGGNLAASFASLEVREGYIEITFDQFKKYVLKESIEEPKEVIPEYVECIKSVHGNKHPYVGQIIKADEEGYLPGICSYKSQTYNECFKPSTKEAFDTQNKPIEKWSVGSYVVFLKDNLQANFRKRGDISEITHVNVNIDNITFGDGICNNIDGEFSVVTNLKWFATKSEAEEFAKTLVGSVKHDNGIIDAIELKEFPKEGHCKTDNVELRNYLFKRPSSRTTLESEWIEGKSIGVGWNEGGYWVISEKSSKPEYQLSQLQKFFTKDEVKQPLKQAVHCTTQEEWDFVLSKFNPNKLQSSSWDVYTKESCFSLQENCEREGYTSVRHFKVDKVKILSFQEWCDLNGYKMEKKVKFEVGKWYKAYYAEKIYFLKYKNTIPRNGYNQINCSEFINNGVYKINDSISNTDLENSFKVLEDLEEIQQYLPDNHPDKIKIDSEFKVGDWVVNLDASMNYKINEICKISLIEDGKIACEGKPTSKSNQKDFKYFRHATPEEINNHLISIGQIPDLDNQESKIYSFKPLQPNDLEWEIKIPNPYSEVLIEQSNGKLDKSLSIFPTFEENPLIQITEFEINKNYFIDFKDPYN